MISTIFALSTAPGKAGVAIFRISGTQAKQALQALGVKKTEPRLANLSKLYFPKTKDLIDNAITIYFPGPQSFTGEDVAELHVHGSRAVVVLLNQALSSIKGLRQAEPGEFTRRALQNGKMDLTEIEGLGDLLDAETAMQHKQALRQMSGELSALYEGWRHQIIKALAYLEAYIDFPDEDIPKDVLDGMIADCKALKTSLTRHLADDRRGEMLRAGIYAAIIGAPNVGKSSLMNYLARRDVAIVSHIAGTTRDIIEIDMDIGGFPLTVADTAGIRESSDEIEAEGIKRARERAAQADLKIVMLDATTSPELDSEALKLVDENSIILINKADDKAISPALFQQFSVPALAVSVKTGDGLDEFLKLLEKYLSDRLSPANEPAITRERHRINLQECVQSLERFLEGIKAKKDIELCAEELRLASRSLGRITGKIEVDHILDQLFSSFCIGK